MSLLSKLFGKKTPARRDGEKLYANILAQSRQPTFYQDGGFADSYEGRIEALTLHMSVFLTRLRDLGENGEGLAQGLFDSMVDDFDIALREESLSDTGVSKRIKPIVRLFYTRAKAYDEAQTDVNAVKDVILGAPKSEIADEFAGDMAKYYEDLREGLKEIELADFARLNFTYPAFP